MRDSLPVISSSLFEGPLRQRAGGAEALRSALKERGCFVLSIEGAGPVMDAATQRWRQLYNQPSAIKQACRSSRDEQGGWLQLRDEPVYMSHMSAGEREAERCKEQFGCAPGDDTGRWPDEHACPGFRRDISACAELVNLTSRALLGGFEALLGQERGFLRYEPGYLALTSYPAMAPDGEAEWEGRELEGHELEVRDLAEHGLQEHSDAVVFTMLSQTAAALQVKTNPGGWLTVPVLPPDSILVIPGDWMELFTNGLIPAVRHRVLELAVDREALVFFQNVAPMRVGPLPGFLADGSEARYPSVDSTIPYSAGNSGVPRWQAFTQAENARSGTEVE